MWSTEQLDVLRERNKDLLNRLKQQREELERPSCFGHSRKREREDEAEERRDSAEILTVTDGESGFARAALARPSVRFTGNKHVCLHEAKDTTVAKLANT